VNAEEFVRVLKRLVMERRRAMSDCARLVFTVGPSSAGWTVNIKDSGVRLGHVEWSSEPREYRFFSNCTPMQSALLREVADFVAARNLDYAAGFVSRRTTMLTYGKFVDVMAELVAKMGEAIEGVRECEREAKK
jgi:hypothetical protein